LHGVPAWAQATPVPAAAASSPAQATPPASTLERVEITGGRANETQQRRESTAAKIIIGRDEIERFGDASVGDLLKRLPGVTMQGRPGRGGAIRMRGLGGGYTQILLDGERVAPGVSLDSLAPEQIERIEILRAPTAETGARAIAGTINIITREGFTKRLNDLRLTLGAENDRLQPAVAWTRNDTLAGLIYNFSLSASRDDRRSDSRTRTLARNIAGDEVTLDQTDTGSVREQRQGLHATGRLQWRGEQGDAVTLTPVLIHGTGRTQRRGLLRQSVGTTAAPYEQADTASDSGFTLLRLNALWNHPLAEGARMEWRTGVSESRSANDSLRQEQTGGRLTRALQDHADTRDRSLSLNGKFSKPFENEHNGVAGGEAESNRRSEARTTLQDGAPLLVDFGDSLQASSTRLALYAQDEWTISPRWAAHAGLRWEGIRTEGGGASNRSSVWTPLLHAVWKPDPKSRNQVRFSLTRSYRSPSLQNLIARPRIDTRDPVPGANERTHPDLAGNPNLLPELATGIDVALERYLGGSGLLSANLFHRQIKNYMRSQTALEDVSWSPGQPRYVSRPQNVGNALTQGIELEAKARLSDLVADAPKIDLRANASLFRSRVDRVPGPDNRLDQQPSYTANLGADYRLPGLPLSVGGNLNWTPGYSTRLSDVQTAVQGKKVIADAFALWVFSPTLQLRTTFSNLDPRDYITGASLTEGGVRETSQTTAPTTLNLQLRLEIKL
jgi:outer membrane receptor for ferrienterochelin and colicins